MSAFYRRAIELAALADDVDRARVAVARLSVELQWPASLREAGLANDHLERALARVEALTDVEEERPPPNDEGPTGCRRPTLRSISSPRNSFEETPAGDSNGKSGGLAIQRCTPGYMEGHSQPASKRRVP